MSAQRLRKALSLVIDSPLYWTMTVRERRGYLCWLVQSYGWLLSA